MNIIDKSVFRSLQTHLPFLQSARFQMRFLLRKMLQKSHEEDFDALSILKLKKDALFLDIGANRGEAIQSVLLKYPHNCRIIGFEPNPAVFKQLKGLYGNDPRIELHNIGLGADNNQYSLFIPYYRKWMFDGLASFDRAEAESWLRKRLWQYKEDLLSIKEELCTVKRLDDFNLVPDFIKIDVQGFELEVLRGAEKTIFQHRPILLIETASERVMTFLKKYDYGFYTYNSGVFNIGNSGLNTFCISNHASCLPSKETDIAVNYLNAAD